MILLSPHPIKTRSSMPSCVRSTIFQQQMLVLILVFHIVILWNTENLLCLEEWIKVKLSSLKNNEKVSKLQWKPLNVITDNVIIRLMLSNWPSPKSLLMNYYLKNLDIVITTSDNVISFFRKTRYFPFFTYILSFFFYNPIKLRYVDIKCQF